MSSAIYNRVMVKKVIYHTGDSREYVNINKLTLKKENISKPGKFHKYEIGFWQDIDGKVLV